MPIPVIIVEDELQPPPLGPQANGVKLVGQIAQFSLASILGISSLKWSIVQKPAGSTLALDSENPPRPFDTATSVFDVPGTQIFRAEANNNGAKEYAECALAVLDPLTQLRKPAIGETTQWDPSTEWGGAMQDLVDYAGLNQVHTATMIDASDTTLTAAEYAKKQIVCAGSQTVDDKKLILPLVSGAWWWVKNTSAKQIKVGGATGTAATIAAGRTEIVRCDGTNYAGLLDGVGLSKLRYNSAASVIEDTNGEWVSTIESSATVVNTATVTVLQVPITNGTFGVLTVVGGAERQADGLVCLRKYEVSQKCASEVVTLTSDAQINGNVDAALSAVSMTFVPNGTYIDVKITGIAASTLKGWARAKLSPFTKAV